MNTRHDRLTRRHMLERLGLAAGCAAAAWPVLRTHADSTSRLDVNDPAAKALGYVENAADVDAKKYPGYSTGSNCENCLQLQGSAGNNYRPCGVFPGKLVSVSGWCTAWTAEM